MKPSHSIIPERERVEPEARRPLTRRETIELAVRQNGKCGCGCGEKLNALTEGVTDEHVIALHHGGTNDLANRSLWRTPCSKAKTAKADAPASAKIRRIEARETGTRRARKPIQGRGFDKTITKGFDGKVRTRKAKP